MLIVIIIRELRDTIENCTALKYKVRDLIKKGELSFEITDEPNVNANPLPNHVREKWENKIYIY